jgi:hypothetical protein
MQRAAPEIIAFHLRGGIRAYFFIAENKYKSLCGNIYNFVS